MQAVMNSEPATLAEYLVFIYLAYLLLPFAGAQLGKTLRGYAGELSPPEALDMLMKVDPFNCLFHGTMMGCDVLSRYVRLMCLSMWDDMRVSHAEVYQQKKIPACIINSNSLLDLMDRFAAFRLFSCFYL